MSEQNKNQLDNEIIKINFTYDEVDFLIAKLYSDEKSIKEDIGKQKYEKIFDSLSKKLAKEKHQLLVELIEENSFYSIKIKDSFMEAVLEIFKYGELNCDTISFIFEYIGYLIFKKDYLRLKYLYDKLFNFLIEKIKS